jgi:hypothetical protein
MLKLWRKEKGHTITKEVMTMAELMEKVQNTDTAQETSRFNFWADKQPCWEKCHCPEMIKAECLLQTG